VKTSQSLYKIRPRGLSISANSTLSAIPGVFWFDCKGLEAVRVIMIIPITGDGTYNSSLPTLDTFNSYQTRTIQFHSNAPADDALIGDATIDYPFRSVESFVTPMVLSPAQAGWPGANSNVQVPFGVRISAGFDVTVPVTDRYMSIWGGADLAQSIEYATYFEVMSMPSTDKTVYRAVSDIYCFWNGPFLTHYNGGAQLIPGLKFFPWQGQYSVALHGDVFASTPTVFGQQPGFDPKVGVSTKPSDARTLRFFDDRYYTTPDINARPTDIPVVLPTTGNWTGWLTSEIMAKVSGGAS
jgi:hypothetical protein